MSLEDLFTVYLRDCFNAGYTMPQFCVDNNIKKPLIVGMDESQVLFLWELHVQFQYDRRLSADFALINGKLENVTFSLYVAQVKNLQLKNIGELNTDDYDKVIVLKSKGSLYKNAVYMNKLAVRFIKRTYSEIPLLNFIRNNLDVKIIQIGLPALTKNKNNNDYEKKVLENQDYYNVVSLHKRIKTAQSKGETISTPYDFLGYSNQKVLKLLEMPKQKLNADGSVTMEDNEYLGIKNGRRKTAYQPEHYKNKIYFLGGCVSYGYGVPFDKTMESYLQKLLNINNLPYRVENEATFNANRREDQFYNLNCNKFKFESGDIVFFEKVFLPSDNIPLIDFTNIFDSPHKYGRIFPDMYHINENGHRALAEYLFKALVSNNFFRNIGFKYPILPKSSNRYGIPQENLSTGQNFLQNKELEEYKKKLREKRFSVGAIVMNCNPFTLGHQQLVEYAAARVKKLYIFVVEEDKSDFKFADRFKLVQEGVREFQNVEVLPSGKFIISQQTFSGYFNKENLQDVAVDSSEDVEIFAREIAPSLGITIRFVGEEPEDSVTRQYNENMRRILPQFNIDFCEIPRREINGEIISAKKVRAALKVGDFDKIKKLVPKSTFKFLLDTFK